MCMCVRACVCVYVCGCVNPPPAAQPSSCARKLYVCTCMFAPANASFTHACVLCGQGWARSSPLLWADLGLLVTSSGAGCLRYTMRRRTLKQVCELNKYMLKSRTVYRLFAEFGMNLDWRLDPPVQKDRSDSARDALLTALRTIVDANPSLFLDEIQAKLRTDFKLKVSVSSVFRYLHRAVPAV